ncbi:P-loop containing nucleoside triphosphate hydrolase protein [Dacryopinax primogenitus]|uniref:p-loop containing nucleoside triphosphate hydrolase protein n=1 Tax=Dacryopinax primogenitus (strain DJM 731) TaxID=1858805 RepID=M5G713_DACPD|nr:P-loop containing nucleoside triphosphate hydrolase protein [Dacryopinax primogenitus]EJU04509.1 P-loop containing nucleoside triphosphate hydrolase protein [Dacryopinax primogenitus]
MDITGFARSLLPWGPQINQQNQYAGFGALYDPIKLFVIGGTVETSRRLASSAWSHFINSFFLTAHFSEEDFPFDWLMHWLAKQPSWHRSREFETTTCSSSSHALWKTAQFDADAELWGENGQEDDPTGKPSMKVVFRPTLDTTHTIFFKGHWLRVRRSRTSGIETLSISVIARSNTILKALVLQAKREYEQDSEHRIQIYFADSHGSFRWTDSRHKRPMSSIVLEEETKGMLLNDCKDFLRPESEKWYADRGIPYRRGYLLWGVPGSGKTSSIHAMAGELDLDIYVITLSSSWVNDATLASLMARVPARCILLLEDLDAAFTRSTTRSKKDTGVPREQQQQQQQQQQSSLLMDANSMPYSSTHMHHHTLNSHSQSLTDTNTLSLSGLLNSLDGVAASEGRLLFATTNHITRLDPALSRPGRMDVWIEFRNATKWQMESLFMNFFPSAPREAVEVLEREEEALEAERADRLAATSTSASMSASASASTSTSTSTLSGARAQIMSEPALRVLAKKFADTIPADEFSVAALQGYLLKHKTSCVKAVEEAGAWVISERELRERLKREKEEKEREEERLRLKEEEEERKREEKEGWRRKREERLRLVKEQEEMRAEEEEERLERKERERREKEGKEGREKEGKEGKDAKKEGAKKDKDKEEKEKEAAPAPPTAEKEEETLEASMLRDTPASAASTAPTTSTSSSTSTSSVNTATPGGWVRIPASQVQNFVKEEMVAAVLSQAKEV